MLLSICARAEDDHVCGQEIEARHCETQWASFPKLDPTTNYGLILEDTSLVIFPSKEEKLFRFLIYMIMMKAARFDDVLN